MLDAEGLSKAAEGNRLVHGYIARARELDATVVVSTVTLAETLRGRHADTVVHKLLRAAHRQPVTEFIGREAGRLLGRTQRRDTVDAIVAVTAMSLGQGVLLLTSDPGDLAALTEDDSRVRVVVV